MVGACIDVKSYLENSKIFRGPDKEERTFLKPFTNNKKARGGTSYLEPEFLPYSL